MSDITPSAIDEREVRRLVRKLGSFRASTREDATRRLEAMGPDAIPVVARLVSEANGVTAVRGCATFALLTIVVAVAAGFLLPRQWLVGVLPSASLVASMVARVASVARWHIAAVQWLTRSSEVCAVGPLLECRRVSLLTRPMRDVVRPGLLRLLPALGDDGNFLNAQQQRHLREVVESNDPDLVIAAIGALCRLRDLDALYGIRKIATGQMKAVYPAARDPRVRAAAQEALPILERLAGVSDAKSLLLTPADPPDGADALLRPAHGVGEANPNTLLRPAEAEETQ